MPTVANVERATYDQPYWKLKVLFATGNVLFASSGNKPVVHTDASGRFLSYSVTETPKGCPHSEFVTLEPETITGWEISQANQRVPRNG